VNVQVHKVGERHLAADLETDVQGRFRADGLAEGDYRLEFSKPNYLDSQIPIQLTKAGSTLVVRMVRLGVITGRVSDVSGMPIRGAVVFAMPKTPDGRPLRAAIALGRFEAGSYSQLDDQGRFRIHSLRPGEYAVAVSYGASTFAIGSSGSPHTDAKYGSGYRFYPDNTRPRFLTVTGGEEHRNIDFSILPTAMHKVSGLVELPEPDQRFLVGLANVDQPGHAAVVGTTKDGGKFELAGVPAGSYHVFVAGPSTSRNSSGHILYDGAHYARSQIHVSGEDVTNLTLTPRPGQKVHLVLRGSGSDCPSSATVSLAALEDWGAHRDVLNYSITISEKPAAVNSLAPSRYAVSVKVPNDSCYTTSETILDLTSGSVPDPVVISIARGGSIRGRVITDGRPATSFHVMVLPVDPTRTAQPSRVVAPDRESRFAIDGLRPGKYRIAALPAGAAGAVDMTRMFEIEVFGGSTLEVDLAPPPVEKRQ
jgi:hypothetical protein